LTGIKENSKPLILEGSEEQKRSAQDTLYTCLEGALLLIHPFMPFVTEELWQRLPRRPNDTNPTIVKAAYPRYTEELNDPDAEKSYDLAFSVVKGIRSMQAEYGVKDKATGNLPTTSDMTKSLTIPSIHPR